MHRLVFALSIGSLAACDSLPLGNDGGAGVDGPPPPPLVSLDYTGSYPTDGSWDLSNPLGDDGLGGVVADILIDQLLGLAGVPSPLEDQAREVIAGAIRQPIVDEVNAQVPDDLGDDSPVLSALDEILSDVAVTGSLALTSSGDPDACSGTETVSRLDLTHDGTTVTASIPELLDDPEAVTISGAFSGGAIGANLLALAPHPLELHYGRLLAIAARDLLDVDVYALGAQASAALSCPAIVAEITGGGDAYDVEVGGTGFSVPASAIDEACAALRAEVAGRALGMFSTDAGIRLGGPARLGDPDGDGVAETVTGEGYGGAITSLPLPFEPQVSASFTATRP